MSFEKTSLPEIELLNELVFKPSHLNLKNVVVEAESQNYSAHTFQINELKVVYRKAKITPTKTGQFVSFWKRNEKGITAPFDLDDAFDLYMIATKTPANFGVFIFPKKVLHEYQILSDKNTDGKRGIRVYPTWDLVSSKQAEKTKIWQTQYFLDLSDPQKIDVNRAKNLLSMG